MRGCKVCGHELRDDLSVMRCGHMFHNMCLNIWKQSFSTCPTCYQKLSGAIQVETDEEEREKPGNFIRTRSERYKSRDRVRTQRPHHHHKMGLPHPTTPGTPHPTLPPLDPSLLNLSIGELLSSPTDPRLYDMECEISKLRLDLKYERRLRRHLEAELEAERRDREHEKQLILHNMSSKTKQDEERPEKSGKREEKRAKKVKNMSRSSSSLFKKSAKSS